MRVPQVLREDEREPWTSHEIAVILGPALEEYEREQATWNDVVARDKANRGLRSPSFVPLRGFCLVGYFTLMRPKNNEALTVLRVVAAPVLATRRWLASRASTDHVRLRRDPDLHHASRSVHRLHVEHLRDSRPARDVLGFALVLLSMFFFYVETHSRTRIA